MRYALLTLCLVIVCQESAFAQSMRLNAIRALLGSEDSAEDSASLTPNLDRLLSKEKYAVNRLDLRITYELMDEPLNGASTRLIESGSPVHRAWKADKKFQKRISDAVDRAIKKTNTELTKPKGKKGMNVFAPRYGSGISKPTTPFRPDTPVSGHGIFTEKELRYIASEAAWIYAPTENEKKYNYDKEATRWWKDNTWNGRFNYLTKQKKAGKNIIPNDWKDTGARSINVFPERFGTGTREWGDSHIPTRPYVPPALKDPNGRQGRSVFPTSSELNNWEKAAEGTRRLNEVSTEPVKGNKSYGRGNEPVPDLRNKYEK